MHDLSPLSRFLGWAFLAWFVCFPVLAMILLVRIAAGASDAALRGSSFVTVLGWLTWPAPVLFVLGAAVLVVDHVRRGGDEAGGRRFVGVLMLGGAAFALGRGHWWPTAAAAVALGLLLVLPARAGSSGPSPGTGAA